MLFKKWKLPFYKRMVKFFKVPTSKKVGLKSTVLFAFRKLQKQWNHSYEIKANFLLEREITPSVLSWNSMFLSLHILISHWSEVLPKPLLGLNMTWISTHLFTDFQCSAGYLCRLCWPSSSEGAHTGMDVRTGCRVENTNGKSWASWLRLWTLGRRKWNKERLQDENRGR